MQRIGSVIGLKRFHMGEIWEKERDIQKLSDEYDALLRDEFNATRKLFALKNEFDEPVALCRGPRRRVLHAV
jgi:hypothetical protein